MSIVQKYTDRAYTDIGAALFDKKANGKFSLFVPVTNIPATGAAPDQQEKTVTTDVVKTYIQGRQDTPQKEFTFYAHRDNFNILKEAYNKEKEFLQINPDGTGWKYNGFVSFYQDEVSVGNNIEGKFVLTVTDREDLPLNDVRDLIEDTAIISSILPDTISIEGTGNEKISVVTMPTEATVTAKSDATGVATVSVSDKEITVTGVAAGHTIVTITTTADNYATQNRTILVDVKNS